MGKLEGAREFRLWRVTHYATLAAEAETLSLVRGISKLLLAFLGKKTQLLRRLGQQFSGQGILRWSFSLMNINYTVLHLLTAI